MRHGGDLLSYQSDWNGSFIDFSSNINPLGYPAILHQVLVDQMEELTRYPDIHYRNLREEVAGYLGCQKSETILGNGAVELIDGMVRRFSRVIVFVPCFIEYIERAQLHQCEVVKLSLSSGFALDSAKLAEVMRPGDLVVLGNPNNPTGRRIPIETLLEIVSIVEHSRGFLLLDEAFFEFCPQDYDSIQLLAGRKSVCVIRAATKFFALPGIRLGYAWTNGQMADNYNTAALPWSINSFANSAGLRIFQEKEYILMAKRYIADQRSFLTKGLKELKGLHAYDTDCNFILVKLVDTAHNEDSLFDFMVKRGILIRKASTFEGLNKSYIRLAVKGQEDNEKLLDGLHCYFG